MPRYAIMDYVPAELRADMSEAGQRDWLLFTLEAKLAAEGAGHRPVGEPRIRWTMIDAAMARMELERLQEAGLDGDAPPGYREGDWMVVVISDTEPVPR